LVNFKNELVRIKETSEEDLPNILKLWNDGNVMSFVGYPDGLGVTIEKLMEWLPWAIAKPLRCHYSFYHDTLGYCGETFYCVDQEHGLAAMDIKLFPHARGKGIAEFALRYAINQAFEQGHASKVYVEPVPENKKAWKLYKKLGFSVRQRPVFLGEWNTYLELSKEIWFKRNKV